MARVILLAIVCALAPATAQARVMLVFHSFNGSLFAGRYPHTFVELTGTLDGDGRVIHENYGYTGDGTAMQALAGPMRGTISVETDEYLKTTNVHFAVPITDQQYFAIRQEVERWRSGPESTYSLDTHNCVNFVARMAELVGLKADVPRNLEKKPKAWLNYIIGLNPQLHAKPVN
jgi:hypothetical protein